MANAHIRGLQLMVSVLLFIRCHGQPVNGFMPGSSPATTNKALATCQQQAVPKQLSMKRYGNHGNLMYTWCTTYQDVLPCLSRTLSSANNAEDWFLKLIYNEAMATKASKHLCGRLPFDSNMTCVDDGMDRVSRCMEWNTRSAIQHYYNLYPKGNQTFTRELRLKASVYACITAVATAGCFHKQLNPTCSLEKRKLLYEYYIMLSGKCRQIAGIKEETTTVAPRTSTAAQSPKAETTTSLFNERERQIQIKRGVRQL